MSLVSRSLWPTIALAGLACSLAAPAFANQATAEACAKKLSPESLTIFQAVAPKVTPTTNLADVMKPTVRGMVMEGLVSAQTARESAMATVPCLKQLKN